MSQLEWTDGNGTERDTYFVNVILPIPIPKSFTYRVPQELNETVRSGQRVIVQFGARKILTGVIEHVHQTPPINYEARYLLDLLEEELVLHAPQLKVIHWIAQYYMCSIGEVLNVALPSGLKLSSESKAQLNPQFDADDSDTPLSDNEMIVLNNLKTNDSLTYQEISQLLGIKNIYHIIKSLVYKEAILLFEQVKDKYKPKIENRVRLDAQYLENSALQKLFKTLESKAKQTEVLLKYLQEVPIYDNPEANKEGYLKKGFKESGLSESSVNTLMKNDVFEAFEIIVSRFDEMASHIAQEITLSSIQQEAKAQILENFEANKPVLLHGITGSGKTEIYIDLIKDAIDSGSQVLYLLPEIALTTQIVARLRKVFGSDMGVYHSKFSDNERVEVWNSVLSGRYSFVVGVRSATFLPFDNLGLIIVDEEHENSYKQYDPAPRYNARDVALYLGQLQHAQVLLGSATPSIESYYNALQNKYGLVTLKSRYGEATLPDTELIDITRERKKKTMKNDFSSVVMEQLQLRLDKKEQAIIFQNRRGYAPNMICEECGWVPKCENCSVSLTYHMFKNELRCHYCGYKEPVANQCKSCEAPAVQTVGFGTEKLEEDLTLMLPDARIQRMDLDTTRSKYSYQRIIDSFEQGEVDILVGTQMVSKGLDFNKVTLVSVLDIDRMLHFPDFRAFERTYQLITQVSGRAGRKEEKGMVLIQTHSLEQPILKYIINNDYEGFYQKEIGEREQYHYPPFYRLIGITIKNKDKHLAGETAIKLYNLLAFDFGRERVLGPEVPAISKIRNQYLVKLLIKLEKGKVNLVKAKEIIKNKALEVQQDRTLKSSRIIFDVDPY